MKRAYIITSIYALKLFPLFFKKNLDVPVWLSSQIRKQLISLADGPDRFVMY